MDADVSIIKKQALLLCLIRGQHSSVTLTSTTVLTALAYEC